MKCAIQLVFDDESQEKINRLREILSKKGVHDEAVFINHISLADIELKENQIGEIEHLLKHFSEEHKEINIVLASAGSFMTKENVLFLTPIMTEDLINYNDKIINLLTDKCIPCGKYYTKNNWQPHCTIAIRLSDQEIIDGFKILKEYNILPLKVTANKIDLLRYEPKPYEELMFYNLQK